MNNNISVWAAIMFLLIIVLVGCSTPDIITDAGIAVYASESGKLVSGDDIDDRIFNVWRQYSGRDPYADFYNGYLEVFTILIHDNEILHPYKGTYHRGMSEFPTMLMHLIYKDQYDCEVVPALEHEYGHFIAFEEGDTDADPDHLNENVWEAAHYANEEITEECLDKEK